MPKSFISLLCLLCISINTSAAPLRHAMAMHGEPAYDKDFQHFDFVNVDAPKTGQLKRAALGSFDTFNGYIVKGVSASGTGYLFDSLMKQSSDEAFTLYGLVAQYIEVPDD